MQTKDRNPPHQEQLMFSNQFKLILMGISSKCKNNLNPPHLQNLKVYVYFKSTWVKTCLASLCNISIKDIKVPLCLDQILIQKLSNFFSLLWMEMNDFNYSTKKNNSYFLEFAGQFLPKSTDHKFP